MARIEALLEDMKLLLQNVVELHRTQLQQMEELSNMRALLQSLVECQRAQLLQMDELLRRRAEDNEEPRFKRHRAVSSGGAHLVDVLVPGGGLPGEHGEAQVGGVVHVETTEGWRRGTIMQVQNAEDHTVAAAELMENSRTSANVIDVEPQTLATVPRLETSPGY